MAINKTDLDQLLNQARVTLLGSSDAGLKGALYDVLHEFFNDSSCWTQDILFNALTTQTVYPLSPNEGILIRLVGVSAPGPLFVSALMPTVGTVVLKHAPNATTQYTATFVTNVGGVDRHQVPVAPDWVLPVWHVGILDGLLGKMMIQPDKGYTSVQQGAYHLKRFRDAIARARVSALRANTNGAQAWRFPQGFRTLGQQGGVPAVGTSNDRTF